MDKKDIGIISAGAVMAIGLIAQRIEIKRYKDLKNSATSAREIEMARRAMEKSNKRHERVVAMGKEIYQKHGMKLPGERQVKKQVEEKQTESVEK